MSLHNAGEKTCTVPAGHFAQAGRADEVDIQAIHQAVMSDPQAVALINAVPLVVLLLNDRRQIVAVNRYAAEIFGADGGAMLGKRPGELIGCVHAHSGLDGCGTSTACKVCGAVQAILQSQAAAHRQSQECRIATVQGESFDWNVTVCPVELSGFGLQCMTIEDISHQKRRQVLERTFFHDIVNTIGALVGFSRMLAEESDPNDELTQVIRLADELMEEVQAQRQLTLAESGDLVPMAESIELTVFLRRLVELYQTHPVADRRQVTVTPSDDILLTTDPRLLRRVLGNMVKNALEAVAPGQTVTVSCVHAGGRVTISVHNPTVMDQAVQLQMFRRSFSTKGGAGRGIGTYSMKLFGENYLGGQVTFTSEPDRGTTFSISLPSDPI